MAPVDAQNLAIPGAILPKWEKTCLRSDRTATQNFAPIGKAPAEKSVTLHTNKQRNKQYTEYPAVYYVWWDKEPR